MKQLLAAVVLIASGVANAANIVVKASSAQGLSGGASIIESNQYLTFTVKEAGIANFTVSVPKKGSYKLIANVIARKDTENSMYFSFDGNAKSVFDFAISSVVKANTYSKVIALEAGSHSLVLSGKEPYIKLASVELAEVVVEEPTTPPPVPSGGLQPDASQFGSMSALPSIQASSIADAVVKMKEAVAGSRVILPSGTLSNINIIVQATGAVGKPVVLDGSGSTILSGKVKIVVKGAYVVLRNLKFKDADSQDYGGGSSLIKFDGCTVCGLHRSSFEGGPAAVMSSGNDAKHFKTVMISATSRKVEIAYNSFKGKQNAGSVVLINRSTAPSNLNEGHRIVKNLFSDRILAGDNANDFDVIRVGDSSTSQSPSPANAEALLDANSSVGNVIEFNLFQNVGFSAALNASCASSNAWNTDKCKGEPEVISVKAPQTIVRFNTFLNVSGGLTLRHGFQDVVEANYFSGKNIPQGIKTIAAHSYGIRIIGDSHLVVNNHIQDVSATSDLLAGISIVPGQPNAALSGYWAVYDSIIAMNFTKNVSTKVISLASDYGGRSKTILAEKLFIGYNVLSGSNAPMTNQASSTSYLSNIVFYQNAADAAKMSGVLADKVTQVSSIATVLLASGIDKPSLATYSGSSGVLSSSIEKQTDLLNRFSAVAPSTSVAKMKKLMRSLKIKSGTVYDNVLPLTENQVGPAAQ